MQLTEPRCRRAHQQLLQARIHLVRHVRVALGDQRGRYARRQVVHVEHLHPGCGAHVGGDVGRHREIHHEQRRPMARVERRLEHRAIEHRPRRAGGHEHDVRPHERLRELAPGAHRPLHAARLAPRDHRDLNAAVCRERRQRRKHAAGHR